MNDFLARAILHDLRFGVAQIEGGAEQLDRSREASGRLGFHQRAEFRGDFVHGFAPMLMAMRLQEPSVLIATGKGDDLAIDGRLLE